MFVKCFVGRVVGEFKPVMRGRNNLLLANKRQRIFPLVKCVFHTSPPRYVPPLLLIILRPVSKILSIIVGRSLRIWWRNLPIDRQDYYRGLYQARKMEFKLYAGGVVVLWALFYMAHIQETPITKRRRFLLFHPDQFERISQEMFNIHLNMHKNRILPTSHPAYSFVKRVTDKLIKGNEDIKQIGRKSWSITIVNDPTFNAFVLPSGQIFVYTGMLRICANDDQLGAVLGHEMSHAVLAHTAELVSYHHILDMIMMVVATAIWALLPTDLTSIIVHFLTSRLKKIILELPYSRMLETEADRVGLLFAAKSCFDVRECSAFWSKMEMIRKMRMELSVEFLSTHPSHERRAAKLDQWLPGALKVRSAAMCPALPSRDPRLDVKDFRLTMESQLKKQLEDLVKEK